MLFKGRKIVGLCPLRRVVLFTSLFFQSLVCIKSQGALDFKKLEFHESHPKTYTLFYVDTSLDFPVKMEDWPEECSKVCKYLSRNILERKEDTFFSTDKKKVPPKKDSWIKVTSKKDQPLIVQLLKRPHDTKVENLIDYLTSDVDRESDIFDLTASLIIMPQNDTKAMVYGFGHWNSLLNSHIVMPQWGLRLLSSTYLFNPKNVREISSKHYRKALPSTRKERSARLSRISAFDVEVGSEGLEVLRAVPADKYSTNHVSQGCDYYKFDVNASETEDPSRSLDSLERIAKHFFSLTGNKGFSIHQELRVFIDEAVRNVKVIDSLNKTLVEIRNL